MLKKLETTLEKRQASWLRKNPPAPVVPFKAKSDGTLLSVTPMQPLPKMLVGWLQIADYMGVSVTVARSFHKDYGLPVIRIARKKVFVHRDAVVEWFFRIDRMQRKFIQEVVDRSAPGHDPKSPRASWVRYLREARRARPDDIDSAHFK